jgi:2-(1,2-epoxy-1,2-dihydrophenyl)acetyl-CoA isomerase
MQEDGNSVLVRHEGAVTTLSFNRPNALNAIDVEMAKAFRAAMKDIVADSTLRALLIRGEGRTFMAGGDLTVLRANPRDGASSLIDPMHEALVLLSNIDAPVIAQVHGVAAGAGLSLMLHADMIVAAENTRFSFAYPNVGASCDLGASWTLPRRVGMRHAFEIAMLGDMLDAASAERMGLVNRVVPIEMLAEQSMSLARRLASGPTIAFGQLRRLLHGSLERDLASQLEAEAEAFQVCAASSDFRAGIDAFFARQKPVFIGR